MTSMISNDGWRPNSAYFEDLEKCHHVNRVLAAIGCFAVSVLDQHDSILIREGTKRGVQSDVRTATSVRIRG